jgi:hypothetical protein
MGSASRPTRGVRETFEKRGYVELSAFELEVVEGGLASLPCKRPWAAF